VVYRFFFYKVCVGLGVVCGVWYMAYGIWHREGMGMGLMGV
jgi:hypothetical protein